MKKTVFLFVALMSMAFVSCGNKATKGGEADTATVDTTVVADTVASDSVDTIVVVK